MKAKCVFAVLLLLAVAIIAIHVAWTGDLPATIAEELQDEAPPAEDSSTSEQSVTQQDVVSWSYAEGSRLAGFTGRPMVLIFGDSREQMWVDLLSGCNRDEALREYFQTTFTCVFVDILTDAKTYQLYHIDGPGWIYIKDLAGPLLGILDRDISLESVRRLLDETGPRVQFVKSPLYKSLQDKPSRAADLVERGLSDRVLEAISLMKRVEGNSDAVQNLEAVARDCGLSP